MPVTDCTCTPVRRLGGPTGRALNPDCQIHGGHRATFTDGNAPAPAVVAVDAQPRAGDPFAIRKTHPR